MFDSIINSVGEKFGLGNKAGSLLSSLLALIASPENGGFGGFIGKFRDAGLGDLVDSWITTGDNTPISNEQLESALGEETINTIAQQTGVGKDKATSALAYMVPQVVDQLTPDGEIPDEESLLSKISGFLGGIGGAVLGAAGAAGAMAGGAVDRVDAAAGATYEAGKAAVGKGVDMVGDAAGAVGNKIGGAMNSVGDAFDGDGDNGGVLKWLIPLLLVGLLIILGFWFCGKSVPPAIPNTNTANKSNTNANASTISEKKVESSFTITAKDGKYTVTGVVPDQKTLDEIKAKLTAEFGAGNVDFSGLKVDASAAPFAAGWWDNFQKLLPNLKGWKDGTLSFVGNAIKTASGLPQAVMDQLKSLFSGWTMPSLGAETSATETRTLTEVSLPDGTKLQAYPGGIEDQLIKFIQSDEYKNGTADTLKDKWFNFDDLNFKTGTAELVPESKRQLDNIVAILKAFPDVKIKIGGYTDKTGNDDANLKLSDTRAKAVKASLEKSGVKPEQVPEAEGYGSKFAEVPATASDKERQKDRKTSVRLLK